MSDLNEPDGSITYFTNSEGKKISCRCWLPKESIRALVFICHGAGEHTGCYNEFAKSLTEHGFKVYAHDHVGHGLSEGVRCHVDSFDEFVRDVFQHVGLVTAEHSDIPNFVIGHSMGGAIALKACLEKPSLFTGMLLIGPAVISQSDSFSWFKIMLARMMSRFLPMMPVLSFAPTSICRDQSIVERYEKDPLVYHGRIHARLAMEILNAMSYICSHLEEITLPLWIIHGTEDLLTEKSGSVLLHEKAASKDKTLKLIEGAYHQVHNEPDGVGTQCVRDICEWINLHC